MLHRLPRGLFAALVVLGLSAPASAANDLSRSPLLIDTATPAPIFTSGVRISALRWVNVAAAGHKLVLVDSNGRKVFEATCPTGATEFELALPLSTNRGLSVLQIDSGLLYLSYE
jgi:hypothetical protein